MSTALPPGDDLTIPPTPREAMLAEMNPLRRAIHKASHHLADATLADAMGDRRKLSLALVQTMAQVETAADALIQAELAAAGRDAAAARHAANVVPLLRGTFRVIACGARR